MQFNHVPVLRDEVLEHMHLAQGGCYLDGTLGGGGHSEAMLHAMDGGMRLYGIDRDGAALEAACERLKGYTGFRAVRGNFHDAKALLLDMGVSQINGALLDLGVSSYQLDTPERGFSYHEDAPLDMRMDTSDTMTAAQYLNTIGERQLMMDLLAFGEEKWAARIAKILVEKRNEKPLETTMDLVRVVDAAIPKEVRRHSEGHPARRTFQAVRIAVNDELTPLSEALSDIMAMLVPGGRLQVISFHSLEDRIVKRAFQSMLHPCVCPPKAPVCTCGLKPIAGFVSKAIKPTEAEVQSNPRARSAVLRVAQHI